MSSVLTKSLVLSQRKSPLEGEDSFPPALTRHIFKNESSTTLSVEIPGVDPSTVEISCMDSVLHVSCEKGELVHAISPASDTSKIKADIKWGLLVIEIPDPPAPVARDIKISLHDAVKEAPNKTKT